MLKFIYREYTIKNNKILFLILWNADESFGSIFKLSL